MPDQRLQSGSVARFLSKRWRKNSAIALVLVLTLASAIFAFPRLYQAYAGQPTPAVTQGDWSTYMYDVSRSGYNQNETIITRLVATHLKQHWNIPSGGKVFSQPIAAGGMVYWGSFDGYEHAANLSGQQVWQQNLGAATSCAPYNPLGVVSSAAVATVPINGTNTSVVFVGGEMIIFTP